MSDKPLNKTALAAAIEKATAVADVLKKLAGKVARGVALPASFTAKGLDYDAQRELERLFGTLGRRNSDGSFYIQLHEFLRGPEMWREAMEYFGLANERRDGGDGKDVFARLKLLEPEFSPFIDKLAVNDEVQHFLAVPKNQRPWMDVFRGVVGRIRNKERSLTTLSQLGADWLGDSKILRSGALRRQLVLMISVLGDDEPGKEERRILEEFMVIDNPYTSNVTVFAPIILTLDNGVMLDFPLKLFKQGMAASLPLETVDHIMSLSWKGPQLDLTTCENAAPFTSLISNRVPAIYTAGYPSLAVKMLLFLMSELGVECVHCGDADLDGFRIADEVGSYISLKGVAASEILKCADADVGIPLAPEQSRRAWAYLSKHPEFRFAEDVRIMLSRGRWIEQESFASIFAAKKRRDAK